MLSSNNFDLYLKKFKSDKGSLFTHTKIGDKNLNIFGGVYNINYTDEFWDHYYRHIFMNNNKEYLTENMSQF